MALPSAFMLMMAIIGQLLARLMEQPAAGAAADPPAMIHTRANARGAARLAARALETFLTRRGVLSDTLRPTRR